MNTEDKLDFMKCLEITGAKLGSTDLVIDIQFAHEDKHYELMQLAADLYASQFKTVEPETCKCLIKGGSDTIGRCTECGKPMFFITQNS